jgi:hypothetical protein
MATRVEDGISEEVKYKGTIMFLYLRFDTHPARTTLEHF